MTVGKIDPEGSQDERALRRFYVSAEVVAPRCLAQMWAEMDSPGQGGWDHPSWSSTPLAGEVGCAVGAGSVSVIPATGPEGLRSVWLTRVTAVQPGYSVTTEMITPEVEQVETIRFFDVDGRSTRLTLEAWYTTVSTAAGVAAAQPGCQRLAQEHLDRVAAFTPDAE